MGKTWHRKRRWDDEEGGDIYRREKRHREDSRRVNRKMKYDRYDEIDHEEREEKQYK